MTPNQLIDARHKLGLTQVRLAEALGVSLRTLQYLESGPVDRRTELAVRCLLCPECKDDE